MAALHPRTDGQVKIAIAVIVAPGQTADIQPAFRRSEHRSKTPRVARRGGRQNLNKALQASVAHRQIQIAVPIPVSPGHAVGILSAGQGKGGCQVPEAVVHIDAVGSKIVAHSQVQIQVLVEIAPGERAGKIHLRLEVHRPKEPGHALANPAFPDSVGLAVVVRAHSQVQVAIAVHVAPGHASAFERFAKRPGRRQDSPVV